jgi:hypothetical protein
MALLGWLADIKPLSYVYQSLGWSAELLWGINWWAIVGGVGLFVLLGMVWVYPVESKLQCVFFLFLCSLVCV